MFVTGLARLVRFLMWFSALAGKLQTMSDHKEKGLSVLSASVCPLDDATPNIFSFAEVLGPKTSAPTLDESSDESGEFVVLDPEDKLEWD